MPRRRANSTTSWTMRKYGPKPELSIDRELAAGPLALLPGEVLGRGEPRHDRLAQGLGKEAGGERRHDVLEGEGAPLGDLERARQGLLRLRPESLERRRLLARAENADAAGELLLFRGERDLLGDGMEEDETVRAPDELEGAGPDERQAGGRPLPRLHVRRPPEVGELTAEVEVAGGHLLPQFGQDAGFAPLRPSRPRAFRRCSRLPLRLALRVPALDRGASRTGGNVDDDEPVGAPDLLPVEDLHQVPVTLRVLHEEDEALPGDLELASEQGPEPGPRGRPLPLAPAVDVADVREGRRRKPPLRRPGRGLGDRGPAPALAENGMDAQGDEHRRRLIWSARPS